MDFMITKTEDIKITDAKRTVNIFPHENEEVSHSYKNYNDLIRGLNSLSMNAQKMYAYIMYNLRRELADNTYINMNAIEVPSVVLRFTVSDYCKAFNLSMGGSEYNTFKEVVYELNRMCVVFDDGKSKYARITVFPVARYDNGSFLVQVEGMLIKMLADASKNYTLLALEELAPFKNRHIWRLYELLKSYAYCHKWETQTGSFEKEFSLSELRFLIGTSELCADSKEKREKGDYHIIYDYELELSVRSGKTKHIEWRDFKKRILEPACKQITEYTQYSLRYEISARGPSGAVKNIKFYFEKKILLAQNEIAEENWSVELKELLASFNEKEINEFLRLAAGNEPFVIEKYKLYQATSGIKNKVAWMKSAIKGDYNKQHEINPKKRTKNIFNDFEQREYDFDELEKILLQ